MGVLCFNLGGHDQLKERVSIYREALKHANPVGSFVNDQVAALCVIHCGEERRGSAQSRRTGRGMVRGHGREVVCALART